MSYLVNQVITFLQNSSTGNSYTPFTKPTTTATFSLGNQQYSLPPSQISTQTGSSFGADYSATATATSTALYQQLNAAGSGLNSNFTVAPGAGSGINAVNDYGVVLFNSALALQNAGLSTTGRWYMSDLTITLYPNPVKSNCTVNTNSTTPQSLTPLTLDGRMLQQKNSVVNGVSIDLSSYPTGVYVIAMRNSSGKSKIFKVMKD